MTKSAKSHIQNLKKKTPRYRSSTLTGNMDTLEQMSARTIARNLLESGQNIEALSQYPDEIIEKVKAEMRNYALLLMIWCKYTQGLAKVRNECVQAAHRIDPRLSLPFLKQMNIFEYPELRKRMIDITPNTIKPEFVPEEVWTRIQAHKRRI